MHRSLRAVILFAVLIASTGCLGPRLAQCPAQGGRPWQEVESEHFTLQTDLPIEEANKAARYLEQTRAAILAAAWPSASTRKMARVTVYVFGQSSDFENLFPRRVAGFFSLQGDEPFIVLHGPPDTWEKRFSGFSEASSSTLKHELTHHLSTYTLLRRPHWLSEGLAEFLETLRLSKDGRTATMGTPHIDSAVFMKKVLDLSQRGLLRDNEWSMQRVLAWDDRRRDEFEDWELATNYSGSWLLVHWLYNTQPDAFARFQGMLAQGKDPVPSQRDALPELSSARLDKRLFEYLQSGSYEEITVQVPPVANSFSERTLDDAEVHALRGMLALTAAGMSQEDRAARRKLARAEYEEVLRLEPEGMLALEVQLTDASPEETVSLSRAAVEAHPHEARAWLLLGEALRVGRSPPEVAEREAAYKKAVELAPGDASAANGLAWLYVTQQRYAEAMPLASRAIELAPWNALILDTFAMAAAGLGRCPEAILAEQRALDMLQEQPNETLEKEFRARLAAFTPTSCVPQLTP
ncbi:hypothetical protein BO221_11480 [Archangium sp. Cb G35]|uniref:DUF1570 domain-containing protein n=1 Tax=Archangium sp. Cb G35 TaxID=1920190 RepID=UPI00093593A0|nr:DUF1570 domain-containing protein [Archangium sp. Cb G35]OJT25001.1 hypothetical protein BO221_11480 [Archangium sp. Cb G35]